MGIKNRFRKVLEYATAEYGMPAYIPNIDIAIDNLMEFMPEELMSRYLDDYHALALGNMQVSPSGYLMPAALLVAGDDLGKLKTSQTSDTLDNLKAKFSSIRSVDSQLGDLIAEINIATLVGIRDEIQLDAPTGVETSNGKKDADIRHIESGWFFEVKNFELGKSNHEKKFSKRAHEIFLDPKNTGKQFQVLKGGSIEEIGRSPNASSISGELFTFRKQYANQIRNAYSKFKNGQKAILVLYNVPFRNQAIQAIENWSTSKSDANRIRAVVIVGRLKSYEGYIRDTHIYYLEENPKATEEFLKGLS